MAEIGFIVWGSWEPMQSTFKGRHTLYVYDIMPQSVADLKSRRNRCGSSKEVAGSGIVILIVPTRPMWTRRSSERRRRGGINRDRSWST